MPPWNNRASTPVGARYLGGRLVYYLPSFTGHSTAVCLIRFIRSLERFVSTVKEHQESRRVVRLDPNTSLNLSSHISKLSPLQDAPSRSLFV
ncbi:hypothetical protein PsorP6_004887 [Peronosclerospora sorghi]|uniref:Uncharacterized protein n=1 Tax=Peronosclerospora sorghi TaxID=230839 RepID=A0ACC0W851_9STRA|nr:hypothetical protein PsorP6_004887 [Peronosclerospora sorghi]